MKNLQYYFSAFVLSFFSSALPDILPETYNGYTLAPDSSSEIQMKSERIDIYWGEVCRVVADFEMINHSKDSIVKRIGFPINLSYMKTSPAQPRDSINRIYNFIFIINNDTIPEENIPKPAFRSPRIEWTGWKCKVPPGKSVIHLTYNVRSNPSYSFFWERHLYYVMSTGSFWKDKIKHAEIAVHFSDIIDRNQVLQKTSPVGYKIDSNQITWNFTDIEPTEKDNIHLEIIDPVAYVKVKRYDDSLKRFPDNIDIKLNAINHFAKFAPNKGYGYNVPRFIELAQFDKKMRPYLSKESLSIFLSYYDMGSDSLGQKGYVYHNKTSFNPQDFKDMFNPKYVYSVFSNTEYFPMPNNFGDSCVVKARGLVAELLKTNPSDCNFWNTFLKQYYRVEFGGCNPCLLWGSRGEFSEKQINYILNAAKVCSENHCILSWLKLIDNMHRRLPDTLGEVYRKTKSGLDIAIQQAIEPGKSIWPFTKKEQKFINACYDINPKNALILKKGKLKEKTTRALIDMLNKRKYYYNVHCKDVFDCQIGN